ncbi:site-2 protease family protein [Trichothermofontia sp.]
MMQAGWRIGSLFGIPLYLDPSWFLIVAFVALVEGNQWLSDYPNWGPTIAYGAGLLMALLLFTSVLLHELGHSVVAISQGIKVNSITLFLFGGIASIEKESNTPGQAFQVAIAGPLVSFGLFLFFSFLTKLPGPSEGPLQVLTQHLASINLVLAIFNLIPGLPLDGGQVLKAAVWKITGNRFAGVRWAARSGQFLGWSAIMLGLIAFLSKPGMGGLWLMLLGWFGVRNADAYSRLTNLQEVLLELKASDAMTREYRVIDANLTLRQFADNYLLEETHVPTYFAASDGRYRGLVAIADLRHMERSLWELRTLNDIAQPLTTLPTVEEKTCLADVINRMEDGQLSRITVLSPAGAVAGVIDRGDIVRAIAQKLRVPIAEADIRRIKEDSTYPPGMQLQVIARMTTKPD